MRKQTPIPWWMEFSLKYWQALLALGAAGIGLIVFLATLNPRLSAAEKKNAQQDEAITKLTTIEETWQKVYQQQQQAPKEEAYEELSDDGEIKVIRFHGKTWCVDMHDNWLPWNKKTKCAR